MMDTSRAAAQEWSWRAPSPPRVHIPPPALDRKGNPIIRLQQSDDHDFEASGFSNSSFLKQVTNGNCIVGTGIFDWKYEQRRTAQRILPFLFLGPVMAARDPQFLQQNGITLVVAVRDTKSAHAKLLGSKAATELGIPYTTIDTAGNQELIAAFPRGIETINAHLSAMYQQSNGLSSSNQAPLPGKVLVFCESGNERSAAMVVAYLMAMYSMHVVNAIQIVQAQRFAVAFDDPMRSLLQTYDAMLMAKRDVFQASRHTAAPSSTSFLAPSATGQDSSSLAKKASKRTLDDHYDDGVNTGRSEASVDASRFEGRAGFAPFFDGVAQ